MHLNEEGRSLGGHGHKMKNRRLFRIACYLASLLMIVTLTAGCLSDHVDPRESASTETPFNPSISISESIIPKTNQTTVSGETKPDPIVTVDNTMPSDHSRTETTSPSEPSYSTPHDPAETTIPSDIDPSELTLPALPVESPLPLQEIFETIVPTVVSIRVIIPKTQLYEQREELFSGLIVEPVGIVITTYSLLEPALDYRSNLIRGASISVCVPGYPKAFEATLTGVHSITDLAMLRITNPDGILFEAATLSKEPFLTVGTTVYSVGYPSDLIAQGGLSTGYVTSIYKTTYQENGAPVGLLETDIPTQPYYAGGPLLNTRGEVVGVTSGYLKRVYHHRYGYAVPSPVVLDVIRQIKERVSRKPEEPKKASFGIVVMGDKDYEEIRERTDYPEGLYVTRIKPESAAYTAGLSDGDILLSLNKTSMGRLDDLLLFMDEQIVGSLVEIKAYRPSEKRTLTLSCYLKEEQP